MAISPEMASVEPVENFKGRADTGVAQIPSVTPGSRGFRKESRGNSAVPIELHLASRRGGAGPSVHVSGF